LRTEKKTRQMLVGTSPRQDIYLSIVVPVYCSALILPELYARLHSSLGKLQQSWELILVDDGSLDESFSVIQKISNLHPEVRGVRLSRNFGHAAAIGIGLRNTRGQIIAIMDDDLQDPPEILPKMLQKIEGGADVVYGVRSSRPEKGPRAWAYLVYYRLLRILTRIEIPNDAGDFGLMRKRVVDAMLSMETSQPFWRGVRAWTGFRQQPFPYARRERKSGQSGYSFKKLLGFGVTGVIGFSSVPLRVATFLGVASGILAISYGVYAVIMYLYGSNIPPGFTALVVLICLLGSGQLLCLGIIGEYIISMSRDIRRWPNAIISEKTF